MAGYRYTRLTFRGFNFHRSNRKRQGLKVACLEGIALRKGWIDANKMYELAKPMMKNQYGQYLLKVIKELGLEQ